MIPDRWRMLLVLFLARTAMAYQFQTVPSDGPFLIENLGLGFGQLGTLIGLYMLPGIVIALPGGMLAQRFGAERMVLAGLALMAIGGALMGIDAVGFVFAGRLISGLGAVFVNVLMTKMVTDWFAGRDIVTAMAVFVASWPLGIALGLISFPFLAARHGTAAVMLVAAVVTAISFALVAWIYRAPPYAPASGGGSLKLSLSRHEWALISFVGFIWGTYNAAYVILVSFLPALFQSRGSSLAEASGVVSILAFALIVAVPIAGYIAERVKRPNLIMIAGFLACAVAAAALPAVAMPMIPFWLIVIASGFPAGLIMALPAQALRPENRAAGMGVFYTWHFAAMAILPALAGSAAAPVVSAGLAMLLAACGLIGFRFAQRRAAPLTA